MMILSTTNQYVHNPIYIIHFFVNEKHYFVIKSIDIQCLDILKNEKYYLLDIIYI